MDEQKQYDEKEALTDPANAETAPTLVSPVSDFTTPAVTRSGHRESFLSRFLFFWRNHKVLSAIFVIVIVLEIVSGGGMGVKGVWNLGMRSVYVENLRYTLTPDRKELVVSYDLKSVRTLLKEPHLLKPRPKELRIPLAPMPRNTRKITVDVVLDPTAQPSTGEHLGPLSYMDEHTTTAPCMGRLLTETGEIGSESATWWPGSNPNSNCRLVIHPQDEPLLDVYFLCTTPRCLLIPYGRDGERRAMLCLKYKENPYPYDSAPFMWEILKKHPEVLKTSRDNGFLMWCLRIVLLPFGLLYDVFVVPVLFVLQLLCLIQFLNLLGRGQ